MHKDDEDFSPISFRQAEGRVPPGTSVSYTWGAPALEGGYAALHANRSQELPPAIFHRGKETLVPD